MENLLVSDKMNDESNIVQTGVKVNKAKWEILKGRGYKLQDIVDNAFNNLLEISVVEPTELLKEKAELEKQLEATEKAKDEYLAKYDNKVKDIYFKINEIEKRIELEEANISIKKAEEEKLEEYNKLYDFFKNEVYGNFRDEDFINKASSYCNKYNEDYTDVVRALNDKFNEDYNNY